ncbi:hypothetical protein HDU82_004394 [Entophlyctis luteolus]|nr:hypothetical protein HDU82_004394 [Entophlyctis luteolus]
MLSHTHVGKAITVTTSADDGSGSVDDASASVGSVASVASVASVDVVAESDEVPKSFSEEDVEVAESDVKVAELVSKVVGVDAPVVVDVASYEVVKRRFFSDAVLVVEDGLEKEDTNEVVVAVVVVAETYENTHNPAEDAPGAPTVNANELTVSSCSCTVLEQNEYWLLLKSIR